MHKFLALGGLLLLVTSCSRKEDATLSPSIATPTVVAAVKVSRQPMDSSIHLVAEFRPYREIDVMAKVSGYLSKINVDMGDRVSTGQVLATLEIPEMADDQSRARATIDRSTAEVARARRREYNRRSRRAYLRTRADAAIRAACRESHEVAHDRGEESSA